MKATTTIDRVTSWEAFDSRGNPTVACEIKLAGGATGQAVVPSGASTGAHEVVELRDGGARYGGKGVRNAVANANGILADALHRIDAADQRGVDAALRSADGTDELSKLGANAILALSISSAIAAADATGRPLYESVLDVGETPLLPMPMVNIVSGGAHAGRAIDIQDILVVPIGAQSFAEAIEWAWRVRRGTADVATNRGLSTALVADEGGLAFPLPTNRSALELVRDGIVESGLTPGQDAAIAVDIAATQFLDGETYRLRTENRRLTSEEFLNELISWTSDVPIVSYEDVLAEDDWPGWQEIGDRLGKVQILGDDLFTTNEARVLRGVNTGVANAVLVKPNQIGTLTAARDVVRTAHNSNYRTVLSARSGETEDVWLSDLAVGWRAGQIKVGSTTRSERTAKWNRLLRIEHDLGGRSEFATSIFD